MIDSKFQPLGYPIPDDRLRLDWERVEAVAGCVFALPVRASMESHLTWYRERRNYYETEVSPSRYAQALDALNRVMETPGAKDRWQPFEYQLNTVIELLEVMAEPLEIECATSNPMHILFFHLWHCIGASGVKLSERKGEEAGDLSLAQTILKVICLQVPMYLQSDQAFAKQLSRALKSCKRSGTRPAMELSQ